MIPYRDLIFGSLAFPTSTFVFAFFWGIYFYDRELVYPTYVEPFIPKWMNYGMHTVILPLVLLEIFVTPQRYPSMGKSLVILGAAALCYQVWILYIYAKTEKWVYPVFEILSPLSKIVFGGIAAIILFFCYMIGRFLHLMIWGDTVVMLDVYKKKSK
ncbi:androgen-dependent TFPI-regulating protein [Candoia aspera]|uniref:androgen-dependent TFPI-regulating protein n=1 Tax=Candoia aspera TaxID=51853 RepID=UPI002FD86AC0